MKSIPLTNSELVVVIDDIDFDRVSKYKWYLSSWNSPKSTTRINGRYAILSRFILGIPRDNGYDVDHINRDTLDNRRENLRICEPGQNYLNKGKQKNCASKYKGVHVKGKKWRALVKYKRRDYYLGVFENEKDAAIAVNNFYALHDPEFRVFNVIE